MSDYRVINAEELNAGLSLIADTIRSKTRIEEAMSFPDGFVSSVNNLVDSKGIIDATIKEVVIPSSATKLRRGLFYDCVSLEKVTFHDGVTEVGGTCFFCCASLKECILPAGVKTIVSQTFFLNYALQKFDCWLTAIKGSGVFQDCSKLTLIIRSDTVCTLESTAAFSSSSIASGTGYIYVPRALVDSYKSATNWSTYANQFRAIEDYPEITGGAA